MSSVNYVQVIKPEFTLKGFQESFNRDSNDLKKILELVNKPNFVRGSIYPVVRSIIRTIENKHKVFICGNGGSMSDASHIASELSGRFLKNRKALPVENLMTDVNFITAIGNDYSYRDIFSRAIEYKVGVNDLVIFLSTSGKSENILDGIKKVREKKAKTILVSGELDNFKLDINHHLEIPSKYTPKIQEVYKIIFHSICKHIEDYYYEKEKKDEWNTWKFNSNGTVTEVPNYTINAGNNISKVKCC